METQDQEMIFEKYGSRGRGTTLDQGPRRGKRAWNRVTMLGTK